MFPPTRLPKRKVASEISEITAEEWRARKREK
jgi:hypothetical protein